MAEYFFLCFYVIKIMTTGKRDTCGTFGNSPGLILGAIFRVAHFCILWNRAWEMQKRIQTAFLLTDKQMCEVIHLPKHMLCACSCVWWMLISRAMTQPRKHQIRSHTHTLRQREINAACYRSCFSFIYPLLTERGKRWLERMRERERMRHPRMSLNTGGYFSRSHLLLKKSTHC